MVSVAKFGGTSVGSAEKLMYAARIIKEAAPECKYITVSAPAFGDKRMTKMLNQLARYSLKNNDGINTNLYSEIVNWFSSIDSGVKANLRCDMNYCYYHFRDVVQNPPKFYNQDIGESENKFIAKVESFGEMFNAMFLFSALHLVGLPVTFLRPNEAGIFVDDNYGNAKLLPDSYEQIKSSLSSLEGYIVIPGYYGSTKKGEIATFSRGGTDLTGAILAASLSAEKYQIFKDDVEGVCTANPKIASKAKTLDEITYREMREMAYLGAEVVHPDVMKLCRDSSIPIIVRGTNNLKNPGTRIVAERDLTKNPIVGITKKDGFAFFTIEQMGMNETVGYLESVLKVFKDENMSVEHMTTSIDSISLCVHQSQINGHRLELYHKLKNALNPDELTMSYDQALICIVGEGMNQRIGTFAEITSALAVNDINIKTAYQTPSEKNVIIGVDEKDSDKAVRVLHNEFFE